jgi:hypothetical protein
MNKIVFLCDWGESPESILKRYTKQTPGNSGVWGDVEGVVNINDADYYVVLEGYSKQLPNNKTIYIKREPDFISTKKQNYTNNILWDETNCGITWWLNKNYDELKNMEYPNKTKKVSCIVSSKHNHRNNFVKNLIKNNDSIELYGKGHDKNYYGQKYKGVLNYDGNCKFRGLVDYKFSVVIENSRQKNYWTEKLADAYLSWCKPVYLGCPNILEYFPKDSISIIDQNTNPNDIDDILNTEISIESLMESRNIILDKFNIWEVINDKIKSLK